MSGVVYVIARVYVMMFEVFMSAVFCVIVPCLCNEVSGMSGVIYAIVPCLCNEV